MQLSFLIKIEHPTFQNYFEYLKIYYFFLADRQCYEIHKPR